MQAAHNGGRAISCVRLVVTFLRQRAFLAVTAVARDEYDKIEPYPEIADLVNRRILGTDGD